MMSLIVASALPRWTLKLKRRVYASDTVMGWHKSSFYFMSLL